MYQTLSFDGKGLGPDYASLFLTCALVVCLSPGLEENIKQLSVTRQQMCQDKLCTCSFTFWEWFYKLLDLIKTSLKREWVDG